MLAGCLLGGLTGCHMTTGACDCSDLPPPVVAPYPIHAPAPAPALAPVVKPTASMLPTEGVMIAPVAEQAPELETLPNR
jgi:hypothetical protein